MNLPSLWKSLPPEGKHALAEAAETTYIYLSQCVGGGAKPSPKLCLRLVAADPRLTLHELRPDIYPASASEAA